MSTLFLFLLLTVLAVPYTGEAADVHFTWIASEGNPQGYIAERKFGLSGTYAEITDPANRPTDTSWTDRDIPSAIDEVPLCWQIRAFNETGTTGPSNEVCLRLPDIPMNIRIEIDNISPDDSPLSIQTRIKRKK